MHHPAVFPVHLYGLILLTNLTTPAANSSRQKDVFDFLTLLLLLGLIECLLRLMIPQCGRLSVSLSRGHLFTRYCHNAGFTTLPAVMVKFVSRSSLESADKCSECGISAAAAAGTAEMT